MFRNAICVLFVTCFAITNAFCSEAEKEPITPEKIQEQAQKINNSVDRIREIIARSKSNQKDLDQAYYAIESIIKTLASLKVGMTIALQISDYKVGKLLTEKKDMQEIFDAKVKDLKDQVHKEYDKRILFAEKVINCEEKLKSCNPDEEELIKCKRSLAATINDRDFYKKEFETVYEKLPTLPKKN